MSLSTLPLDRFLSDLSSGDAVPGGGSVAALSGALGASLLAMVCRLTIGKKGYETVSTEMETHLASAMELQAKFSALMEADVQAYTSVMDAYKLPRSTDAEKAERAQAVQQALKAASTAPLHVAEGSLALMELCISIAAKGNKNAASDAGVGALMADAGLRGALLNVRINLSSILDQEYVADYSDRTKALEERAAELKTAIMRIVQGRL